MYAKVCSYYQWRCFVAMFALSVSGTSYSRCFVIIEVIRTVVAVRRIVSENVHCIVICHVDWPTEVSDCVMSECLCIFISDVLVYCRFSCLVWMSVHICCVLCDFCPVRSLKQTCGTLWDGHKFFCECCSLCRFQPYDCVIIHFME